MPTGTPFRRLADRNARRPPWAKVHFDVCRRKCASVSCLIRRKALQSLSWAFESMLLSSEDSHRPLLTVQIATWGIRARSILPPLSGRHHPLRCPDVHPRASNPITSITESEWPRSFMLKALSSTYLDSSSRRVFRRRMRSAGVVWCTPVAGRFTGGL